MKHTDYRTLIDRGRRAGLRTGDIYRAIGAHRAEAGDASAGITDGNGYISGFNGHGQRVFRQHRRPPQ